MVQDTLLSAIVGSPRHTALLDYFMLAKKVEGRSPRTLGWYQDGVGDFNQFCLSNGLDPAPHNVRPQDVRAWLADLQNRLLSKTTINDRFRALRVFFNWCVAEEILDKSPLRNIRTPSIGKRVVPVFSQDHIRAMLYLCPPSTWWGARDRAIILTLLHTGVRLSELLGLQITDIDFPRDQIKVKGKGDKEPRIYLSPECQKAILRYLRHRTDDLPSLWVSKNGMPLGWEGVRQVINRLGKRAGICDVRCSPHTFRHTFAVSFLKAGGDLRHLQEIMGHTSMKPLEMYLRTVNADDAIQVHRQITPFKGWKL